MAFGPSLVEAYGDGQNDNGFVLTLVAPDVFPAGNGIVVSFAQGQNRRISTLVDSESNAYTRQAGGVASQSNVEIWDCLENEELSAGESITVTIDGTDGFKRIAAYSLGGPATRIGAAAANGSGNNASVSLTGVPAGAAVMAVVSFDAGNLNPSWPADWTIDSHNSDTNASSRLEVFASRTTDAAGTVTFSLPVNSSRTWRAAIVAYESAGGEEPTEVNGAAGQAVPAPFQSAGGTVSIGGSASQAGTVSSSASGDVDVAGSGAQSFALVQSSTGAVPVSGSASHSLSVIQSASASARATGTASHNVALSQNASGDVDIEGEADQSFTLGQSAYASLGSAVNGSATQSIQAFSQSGTGDVDVSGSAAQMPALFQAAAGTVAVAGAAARAVALSSAALGAARVRGSAAQVITLSQSADGSISVPAAEGAASQTVPSVSQAAAGAVRISGSASHVLQISQFATGGRPAVMGDVVLVGTGHRGMLVGKTKRARLIGASNREMLRGETPRSSE